MKIPSYLFHVCVSTYLCSVFNQLSTKTRGSLDKMSQYSFKPHHFYLQITASALLVCSLGRNWITSVIVLMYVYFNTKCCFWFWCSRIFLIQADRCWTSACTVWCLYICSLDQRDSAVQFTHLVYKDFLRFTHSLAVIVLESVGDDDGG